MSIGMVPVDIAPIEPVSALVASGHTGPTQKQT
jgi:hypothetical protein